MARRNRHGDAVDRRAGRLDRRRRRVSCSLVYAGGVSPHHRRNADRGAVADGIVTYELTMLGAVIATVITLLVTARLPNWGAKLYDPEISHGKILIGVVDPSDEARAELENRLRRAGAEKVKVTAPEATR